MGRYWLHDLDTVLRPGVGNGITHLELIDGWEFRSRSSGGLDSINGILDHHTASPYSWDWERDIDYIAFRNPYAPSPISQLYVSREGKCAIIAAGAANHGGSGGAYVPGGPQYVDVDMANRTLIGKEMGNGGTGEIWPWEQIYASLTIDALICLAEGWHLGHVFAHKEYCGPGTTTPGRKIDPFGDWENHPGGYWRPNSSWGGGQSNISYYRELLLKRIGELSQEATSMHSFVPRSNSQNERILDTRKIGFGSKINRTEEFVVNVPGGAGKGFAIVNLTVADAESKGYLTAWASGSKPNSSKLNWGASEAVANEVTVPLADNGTFRVWVSASTHLIVDLVGYYQRN